MLGNSYGSHNLTIRKHACRLRYILHQLNSGQLSMDNLKKNLEYMTLLLETEYMDETRRICDEENDLADVKPEVVSDEVRKWLAATFTKQSVDLKREKPKLKSVANAILTGIFFDKMFRKSQVLLVSLPPDIVALMKNLNSWSFDCFRLNEVSEGHALKYVGLELFSRYRFLDRYKIPVQTLENYIAALEVGYSKHNNPYHNIIHAADVTASSHFMLSQTGFATSLSDLDTLAVIFGAMIHDYQHTGHTNNFHIQAGELRNLLIEIVLATDMSSHFAQIKTMKAMLSSPEGIDKTKAICLIVHACDISHASKPWELHSRWTEGVLEEFFRQGDLEASMGLPYSPLCDRNTVHVADSQIGFIDFIVEPTMIICGEMLTRIIEPLVPLRSSNTFLLSENSDSLLPSVDITQESETGNTSYNERNSSFRFLPLNQAGKLEIPTPWMEFMQENKDRWKKRAAKEEDERKKSQAIAAK
uniref:Phosphodiesterase n=1 Tax=Loa loa TaxID=7209 RepID=A0A1I7VEE9_LOALO